MIKSQQKQKTTYNLLLSLSLIFLLSSTTKLLSHALIPPVVPPALVHLGIGASSGTAGAVAAYPLDLVKSRLQTTAGRAAHGTNAVAAALEIVSSSPLGPLALYRGCLVQMAGIAPEKTIKLTTNDMVRAFILSHYGALPLGGEVVAGGLAGFCQVLVTNPLEVVKLKLQTTRDDNYSLSDVWEEVGGVLGMYKGVLSCLARDVTFSAILFPGYAHLKVVLPMVLAEHGVMAEVDPIVTSLLAGSIAAAPAAFVGTPFDVVKTRLQQAREKKDECLLDISRSTMIPNNNNPSTIAEAVCDDEEDSLSEILQQIKEEGAWFSGWTERCMRSCLQFGVTLSLFEMLNVKAAEIGML